MEPRAELSRGGRVLGALRGSERAARALECREARRLEHAVPWRGAGVYDMRVQWGVRGVDRQEVRLRAVYQSMSSNLCSGDTLRRFEFRSALVLRRRMSSSSTGPSTWRSLASEKSPSHTGECRKPIPSKPLAG